MESSSERNISREEFNGLGQKVSELRESCIGCKTRMESEIMHLNEEQKELKKDMIELKQSIKELSEKIQALTIKLSLVVSVIVTAINFIVPFFMKKFGA